MIVKKESKSQIKHPARGAVQNRAGNVVTFSRKDSAKLRKHIDTVQSEIDINTPLQRVILAVRKKEKKLIRNQSYQALNALSKNGIVPKRVQTCGKPRSKLVEGRENKFKELAISKIETCSSVHSCPVCRNKIKAGREEELSTVEESLREDGYNIYMATFTCRHNKGDKLAKLLGSSASGLGFLGSWRKLIQGKKFRKFKKTFGIDHYIRVTEDTWSKTSGWHYHFHVWFISKNKFNDRDLINEKLKLFELWKESSKKAGLKRPSMLGFDLQLWEKGNSENYLMKSDWSASQEIMAVKTSGKSGYNIYQLERMLIDAEYRQQEEFSFNQVKSIIKERSKALKGTRLLTYSHSLKDLRKKLFDKEKTDEELAHMDVKETTLKFLVKARLYWRLWYSGIIGDIKTMYFYESGGVEAIKEFITGFFPEFENDIIINKDQLLKYEYTMKSHIQPEAKPVSSPSNSGSTTSQL